MTIRSKLTLKMLLLVLIPVIIFNFVSYYYFQNKSMEEYTDNVTNYTEEKCDKFNEEIIQCLTSSQMLLYNDKLLNYVEQTNNGVSYTDNKCIEIINLSVKQSPCILNNYVINNKKKIVLSSDVAAVGKYYSDYDNLVVYEGYKNGVSQIIKKGEGESKTAEFYIVSNLVKWDRIIGYYVIECSADEISDIISAPKEYNGAESILVYNDNGISVRSLDYDIDELINSVSDAEVRKEIDINNFCSGLSNKSLSTDTYLASKTVVESTGWKIFSYVKKDIVKNHMFETVVLIVKGSAIVVSILAIVILIMSYNVMKPIKKLSEMLFKRQKGDKNVRYLVTKKDEIGIVGTALNIVLDDVYDSELRYQTIVEMVDNIVFEINFEKDSVYISNNFCQKFSFKGKSDKLQDSFFVKGDVHPEDKVKFYNDFDGVLGKQNTIQGEYRFKNNYGEYSWILIRGTKFIDRMDRPTKIVGVIVDIDKEKRSEMQLMKKANYDALTEVYNRETFLKALDKEFDLSLTRRTPYAILFIDLDDFKHYNDIYGHACGDEVLLYCAKSLKEVTANIGFPGRFGGDEFVVCLNNIYSDEYVGQVAASVIKKFAEGFISESTGQYMSINCSIGIAFFHFNGRNPEEVLAAADEAMYSIKKHGKSNFAYAEGLHVN